MTCKYCQEALLELAGVGVESTAELRTHLHSCQFCREALQRERNLFASIDACLQTSANPEIPPSFLPQVRARIAAPTIPFRNSIFTRGVVFAIVAAASLLLSMGQLKRRLKIEPGEKTHANQQAAFDTSAPAARMDKLNSPTLSTARLSIEKPRNKTPVQIQQQSPQPKNYDPEIIVPGDQEALLARYADQLTRHHRNSPVLITRESAFADAKPLQVDLIQIAQLDVKPLVERQE